jgi:hypothetical protein
MTLTLTPTLMSTPNQPLSPSLPPSLILSVTQSLSPTPLLSRCRSRLQSLIPAMAVLLSMQRGWTERLQRQPTQAGT